MLTATFFILRLLTIATIPEQTEQIECCIYEFHPHYMIFTDAVLLNSKNSLYQFIERHPEMLADTIAIPHPLYHSALPDLYAKEDLFEVTHSPNIDRFVTEWDTTKWRGEVFNCLRASWLPPSIQADSFFWVQGKVKRLPHLHTHNVISPGRAFELGVNATFNISHTKARLQIFTFPKSTKLIETFGFTPNQRFDFGDHYVLLYELPEGRQVSSHVTFILPDTDVSVIEMTYFLKTILNVIGKTSVDSTHY
jgi:hypothetical protein